MEISLFWAIDVSEMLSQHVVQSGNEYILLAKWSDSPTRHSSEAKFSISFYYINSLQSTLLTYHKIEY